MRSLHPFVHVDRMTVTDRIAVPKHVLLIQRDSVLNAWKQCFRTSCEAICLGREVQTRASAMSMLRPFAERSYRLGQIHGVAKPSFFISLQRLS